MQEPFVPFASVAIKFSDCKYQVSPIKKCLTLNYFSCIEKCCVSMKNKPSLLLKYHNAKLKQSLVENLIVSYPK